MDVQPGKLNSLRVGNWDLLVNLFYNFRLQDARIVALKPSFLAEIINLYVDPRLELVSSLIYYFIYGTVSHWDLSFAKWKYSQQMNLIKDMHGTK